MQKTSLLPLIMLFFLLGGCQNQEPPTPLLLIGDRKISMAQFRAESGPALAVASEQPAAEQQHLQRRLLAQLIDRELILLEAEKRGLQITPGELEEALAALRGTYSREEFEGVLNDSGQDPEQWRKQLRLRLLTEKVAEQVTTEVAAVTLDDAEKYYKEHQEEFQRPDQLRARQILVNSREEADRALARLEQGADFSALAREISISPDRDAGGDLGFFARNQLPPEFDEVLFKLPIGRISDPVASPYGHHLFLVDEKRKAGIEPFARVQDELVQRLHQERKEQAFATWLRNLKLKTPVYIDWAQLQPQTEK